MPRKGKISGYILFFMEKRSEIAVQISLENRKHTDGVREIGKRWKALTETEKNYYNELAKN